MLIEGRSLTQVYIANINVDINHKLRFILGELYTAYLYHQYPLIKSL